MINRPGITQCNANVKDTTDNRKRTANWKGGVAVYVQNVKKTGPLVAFGLVGWATNGCRQHSYHSIRPQPATMPTCCQVPVPNTELEIVRWTNPPSQTVLAGSWWYPLGAQGGWAGDEKHLPWLWGGKEGREARPGVLISLQTPAS